MTDKNQRYRDLINHLTRNREGLRTKLHNSEVINETLTASYKVVARKLADLEERYKQLHAEYLVVSHPKEVAECSVQAQIDGPNVRVVECLTMAEDKGAPNDTVPPSLEAATACPPDKPVVNPIVCMTLSVPSHFPLPPCPRDMA